MPTREELKELQSQTLERKIQITQTRIIEWYLKFEGKVYVSFSGGKDSTVLLHMVRKAFPDVEAVFVNTGLEYPEIVSFVKTFENVTIVRPKMGFKEVIDKYGYPVIGKEVAHGVKYAQKKDGSKSCIYFNQRFDGTLKKADGTKSNYCTEKYAFLLDAPFKISDQCCDVMKKKPAHDFSKKSGKMPIVGTMAHESRLRQQKWIQNGCNSFDQKNPVSNPMSFWTDQDVLLYLKKYDLPYCSVYGDIVPRSEFVGQLAFDEIPTDLMTTGCQRTGCMFCMFGVHLEKEPNRMQRMKQTHPKQYDYCIRENNGLGIGKVLDFINVKY